MTPRLMTPTDVPAAFELSTLAGWNQTVQDWRRMIELEPRGCFAIDSGGALVATTTLLCYGTDLAWLGMVLTHPDHQRMGHARRLVTAAVDEAHGRGVRCIKLDATDQGRPLYESLGFIGEQPIERWRLLNGPAQPNTEPRPGPIPFDMDTEAFGTDRRRFVQSLEASPIVDSNGYILTRPGTRASYLGPCVARDADTARRLAAAALTSGQWFWDLLPSNAAALQLATDFGFQTVRRLVRMRLGRPIATKDEWVFAIAGFEAG